MNANFALLNVYELLYVLFAMDEVLDNLIGYIGSGKVFEKMIPFVMLYCELCSGVIDV